MPDLDKQQEAASAQVLKEKAGTAGKLEGFMHFLDPAMRYGIGLLDRIRRRSEDPDTSFPVRFVFQYIRTLILAFMSFGTNQVPVRASALTYTTFLSIVPFLAIFSAVAGAFGYLDLISQFLPLLNEALNLNLPLEMVYTIIIRAQEVNFRQLGLIGSGSLLVVFIIFMSNIELALDHIWDVGKRRTILQRLKEYLPFLLLLIILILIAAQILLRYRDFLATQASGVEVPGLVYQTIFFISLIVLLAFIWIGLTLLLFIVPNTRVRFGSAVLGSTTSALVIFLFSRLMLFLPNNILTGGRAALYGSLAVIPALLLVFYLLWVVVLFGASVGFVYQRLYLSRQKSTGAELEDWKNFSVFEGRSVQVLSTVYALHAERKKLVLKHELQERLDMPESYLDSCLAALVDLDILTRRVTRAGDGFVPGKAPEKVDLMAMHNLILRLEPGEEGQIRALTAIDELRHTLGRLYSSGRLNPPMLYSHFSPDSRVSP